MKWLTDVLERCGIVPSDWLADQIFAAIPRELVGQVLKESAAAVLFMRGCHQVSEGLAGELARRGAESVLLALEVGDHLEDETRVVEELPSP